MTIIRLLLLGLMAAGAAQADFSYTSTRKGMPMGGDQSTKYYLKGNRMLIDNGSNAVLLDFDAQTTTTMDRAAKTYTVTKFADEGTNKLQDVKVDAQFKETGQHRTISGYDCVQGVMTMAMDMPQSPRPGMKMNMEIEFWVSRDVPGASELVAFYKRNMGKFPLPAMESGGNSNLRAAMVEMQKRMMSMPGAPVLEVVRNKMSGGPTLTPEQQEQLGALQARGGAAAAAAQRAMAAMGGGGGMEITIESSNFSAAPIPDSTLAIPAGYQQK